MKASTRRNLRQNRAAPGIPADNRSAHSFGWQESGTRARGSPEWATFQWLLGSSVFSTPVGPNPFDYTAIVYTLRPYPIRINPNQIAPFSADVGIVPEPGTMVLLGTGLAGAALARRRRRKANGGGESANPKTTN